MKQINTKGFTLIEMLVFISILSMFFVSATAITIVMIRNANENLHKMLANQYLEETFDWLQSEKEADWLEFIAKAPEQETLVNTVELDSRSKVYCLNDNALGWPQTFGSCSSYGLHAMFKRELYMRSNGLDRVEVAVKISWKETSTIEQKIISRTQYSIWEQVEN